jgi:hypothetical protein
MIEDRLVGIKSREIYEVPGAITLITAHRDLEDLTLEKELAEFKRVVEGRYAQLVYNGQWFGPLKRASTASSTTRTARSTARCASACTRGARRRRPAQRGLGAVRLRPRDLRRGRPVRPVARRGLRQAVGPAAAHVGGDDAAAGGAL